MRHSEQETTGNYSGTESLRPVRHTANHPDQGSEKPHPPRRLLTGRERGGKGHWVISRPPTSQPVAPHHPNRRPTGHHRLPHWQQQSPPPSTPTQQKERPPPTKMTLPQPRPQPPHYDPSRPRREQTVRPPKPRALLPQSPDQGTRPQTPESVATIPARRQSCGRTACNENVANITRERDSILLDSRSAHPCRVSHPGLSAVIGTVTVPVTGD